VLKVSLTVHLLRRNHFAKNAAIPPVPAVLPARMAAVVATYTGQIRSSYSGPDGRDSFAAFSGAEGPCSFRSYDPTLRQRKAKDGATAFTS
jgi:hypothetical protein